MKRLALLLVVFSLLFVGFVSADPADGLVAYYPLDSFPIVIDEQGLTNGSSTGVNNVSGVGGSAYNFSDANNTYVNFSNTNVLSALDGSPQVSWNFLLNRDSSGSEELIQYFGTTSGGNGFSIRILSNGSVQANVRSAVADTPADVTGGITGLNNWEMWSVVADYANDRLLLYRNTSLTNNISATWANSVFTASVFGSPPTNLRWGTDNGFSFFSDFLLDNVRIYDRALNTSDLETLYDEYFNPDSGNWTVTVVNNFTGDALVNVSLVLSNGTIFSNGTGNYIVTDLQRDTGALVNYTLSSPNYFNRSFVDVNISSDATDGLVRFFEFRGVSFGGIVEFNGTNFTRDLNYSVNFTCNSVYGARVWEVIDGVIGSEITGFSCGNETPVLVNGSYEHPAEEGFVMGFFLNSTFLPSNNSLYSVNQSFSADLESPSVFLDVNFSSGFDVALEVNVSLRCLDTVFGNLSYNTTVNGEELFSGYFINDSTQTNLTSDVVSGDNVFVGFCSDPFSSNSSSLSQELFFSTALIWDEVLNQPFDVFNVSSVKLWFGDDSDYFDFQSENQSNVTILSSNVSQLRLDIGYAGGDVVTRFVDLSLLNGSSSVKICANEEGVLHYEQFLVSGGQHPVIMQNTFTDCLVAADYTRFAYQDAFLLKAFTITSSYFLYIFDGFGVQTLLASIDGSVATTINIDTLEFASEAYDIGLLSDALSVQQLGNSSMVVRYLNLAGDVSSGTLSIRRLDTDSTVFSTSSFVDPDNWTFVFDWSSLSNVTNQTLFKLSYDYLKTDGSEGSIVRFINSTGGVGRINSVLAAIVSLMIMFFGFSLVAVNQTFSWFGILMAIFAMVMTSFGVPIWYLTFMFVIESIFIVYFGVLLWQKNSGTVI